MRAMAGLDRQIGRNLRALRKKRGMSQAELSAVIGVSFQQLQKYERGENRLSAGRLYILSHFFDVPYNLFFFGLEQGDHALNIAPELQELCCKLSALKDQQHRAKIVQALSLFLE